MVMAPTISAITALGECPASARDEGGLRAGVVGRLGAATPRMLPLPNGTSPGLQGRLFHRVAANGCHQRTATGQDAQHRAQAVPRSTAAMRLKSSPGGHQALTVGREHLALALGPPGC